jgi:hypothetical protein
MYPSGPRRGYPRPAPPRPEPVEPREPLHRLVGRGSVRQGEKEARSAGTLLVLKRDRGRPGLHSVLTRAVKTLHLALEEMGRLWVPVHGALAAQRAPLRRLRAWTRPRPKQRYGEEQFMLAAQLRHPPPPMPAGHELDVRGRRSALPGSPPSAGHRVPGGRGRPAAPVLVRRHRPRPDRRPHRARSPPTATASGPSSSTWTRDLGRGDHRAGDPHRRARSSTSWTDPGGHPAKRPLGDPEAIAAAAEAVRRQGDR